MVLLLLRLLTTVATPPQTNSQGMWDDTVFVFASDNGGPVFIAGDNGPLRGGKAEFYEGGLLAPAFIHFGVNTLEVITEKIRIRTPTSPGPPRRSQGARVPGTAVDRLIKSHNPSTVL